MAIPCEVARSYQLQHPQRLSVVFVNCGHNIRRTMSNTKVIIYFSIRCVLPVCANDLLRLSSQEAAHHEHTERHRQAYQYSNVESLLHVATLSSKGIAKLRHHRSAVQVHHCTSTPLHQCTKNILATVAHIPNALSNIAPKCVITHSVPTDSSASCWARNYSWGRWAWSWRRREGRRGLITRQVGGWADVAELPLQRFIDGKTPCASISTRISTIVVTTQARTREFCMRLRMSMRELRAPNLALNSAFRSGHHSSVISGILSSIAFSMPMKTI
jgi:hypothetical protein